MSICPTNVYTKILFINPKSHIFILSVCLGIYLQPCLIDVIRAWAIPNTVLNQLHLFDYSTVFCIGFLSISVYTSSITPPSMHSTLQAVIGALHWGFGKHKTH